MGDYVNGALHEGCAAENETVTTLRNLTATGRALGKRLIYQATHRDLNLRFAARVSSRGGSTDLSHEVARSSHSATARAAWTRWPPSSAASARISTMGWAAGWEPRFDTARPFPAAYRSRPLTNTVPLPNEATLSHRTGRASTATSQSTGSQASWAGRSARPTATPCTTSTRDSIPRLCPLLLLACCFTRSLAVAAELRAYSPPGRERRMDPRLRVRHERRSPSNVKIL